MQRSRKPVGLAKGVGTATRVDEMADEGGTLRLPPRLIPAGMVLTAARTGPDTEDEAISISCTQEVFCGPELNHDDHACESVVDTASSAHQCLSRC